MHYLVTAKNNYGEKVFDRICNEWEAVKIAVSDAITTENSDMNTIEVWQYIDIKITIQVETK